MASTPEEVRKAVRLEPSRDHAGWVLPIKVVIYDRDVVKVNDTIVGRPGRPSAERLLAASRFIAEMLEEAQVEIDREARARMSNRQGGAARPRKAVHGLPGDA